MKNITFLDLVWDSVSLHPLSTLSRCSTLAYLWWSPHLSNQYILQHFTHLLYILYIFWNAYWYQQKKKYLLFKIKDCSSQWIQFIHNWQIILNLNDKRERWAPLKGIFSHLCLFFFFHYYTYYVIKKDRSNKSINKNFWNNMVLRYIKNFFFLILLAFENFFFTVCAYTYDNL